MWKYGLEMIGPITIRCIRLSSQSAKHTLKSASDNSVADLILARNDELANSVRSRLVRPLLGELSLSYMREILWLLKCKFYPAREGCPALRLTAGSCEPSCDINASGEFNGVN